MNAKYFLTVILLFSFAAFAQNANVPAKVTNSFKKLYPKATEVKWDKEGKDKFEAGFTQNGIKTSVVLDEEGEIEETETQIQLDELPSVIVPFVNSNYKGFTISEAAKIVDEDGNVNFEAEISNGNKKQDLLFDKSGKPLQKKSGSNDEEDQD